MTGAMPPPHELVARGLAASRSQGCVVLVEESSQSEVRFANNTTTTNGVRHGRRVTVASFRAANAAEVGRGRTSAGVASAGGDVAVEALVRASEAEADGAPPAEDAAPLVAPAGPDGGFEEGPELTTATALDPVLEGLAAAFGRARGAGTLLSGFALQGVDTTYLGSSTDLRLRHVQRAATLELVARDGDGSRSVWAGAGAPGFEELDVAALEHTVDRRLAWAARRVELPAGRYEVLLPPDAAADLMVALSESMSGRDAEEGRSPFAAGGGATRTGQRLCPLPFALRGDPGRAGLTCAPFLSTGASGSDVSVFDNGLLVAPTDWVEDGTLRRLRYHRAAAARSGVEPSPPVDNLVLELPGAQATLEDMVASTERALLLTCLWYIREVDPVTLLLTGLTRDGVYLVERGDVVGAVNNFRFNESPLDVLARTVEAGRTERALSREWGEWMPRTAMPPLRVADFNMSSVSPAT